MISGFRSPNGRPGRNGQYNALFNEGLVWDSSVSSVPLDTPVWPYTLDHQIPHKCKFENSCPTKAFPGVWEIPMNAHFVADQTGGTCTYFDQCVFTFQTKENVFDWIKEDFLRHYEVAV